MAVHLSKDLDDEAIAAQFAAAEAANLSFKSTAALRGGSKPSSDPDQRKREQDRQRRLDFFERKPRPEQNTVQQYSTSPPSRSQNILEGLNLPPVERDPKTGLPKLFRPGVKLVNHFQNSPAKPFVPKRRNKNIGFAAPPTQPSFITSRHAPPSRGLPPGRIPPRPLRQQIGFKQIPMSLQSRPRVGASRPVSAPAGRATDRPISTPPVVSPALPAAAHGGMAMSRWSTNQDRIMADLGVATRSTTTRLPTTTAPISKVPPRADFASPTVLPVADGPIGAIKWEECIESDGRVSRL